MPRTSVVIPTRNRVSLLRTTLDTLVRQRDRDFEIVVADNASSDGTDAFVRDHPDPRVRLARSEKSLSQMANWTRALSLGSGRYIALYHDDDLYSMEILSRCAALLDANPAVGLVHTAAERMRPDGRPAGTIRAARHDFVRPGRHEALRWIQRVHDVVPSSTLLRRAVVERIGGFVEDLLCADFDFYVRLALVADVAFVADSLVRVRIHPQSTTSTMSPRRWVEELDRLVPRLRGSVQGAGLLPPGGFAAAESGVRRTFGRRLLAAGISTAASGNQELARAYADAAWKIDPRAGARLESAVVRVLAGRTGRSLLRLVRAGYWRTRGWSDSDEVATTTTTT